VQSQLTHGGTDPSPLRRRAPKLALAAAAIALAFPAMAGVASQQAGPPAAQDLARRLQAHYDTVRDFTADFTHAYRGGALHQSMTEQGQVRVKKPGRMYWTYTSPEKKEFVSDGVKIYSYIPADKVVYVSDVPTGDQASTGLLFLTGRGDLLRDFHPAVPKTQPPDAWQLDLVPQTQQQDFTSLSLRVDPRSLVLKGLTTTDLQDGVSTFTFANLRENTGLTDNQFVFKVPRGVEIRR
jgi:outer membrane lipoprotein carrier protein